jgi:hypothetical protein
MTQQIFLVLGFSSVRVEDTIEYFRGVHDQVKHETTDRNAKYKAFSSQERVTFEVGNLV